GQFERPVNAREREEGLTGKKCGYVEMNMVNDQNFHALLSEDYLRPPEVKKLSEAELDGRLNLLAQEIKITPDVAGAPPSAHFVRAAGFANRIGAFFN